MSSLISVTGYPGDRANPYPTMVTMSGAPRKVTNLQILYDIQTSCGQSGAGVWTIDRLGNLTCCGVHAYGGSGAGGLNSAVRVTDDFLDQVKSWILGCMEG